MRYSCPVCKPMAIYCCRHELGKYTVYLHANGNANIYMGRSQVVRLRLKCPKKLSEEYIDMLMLLK